MTPSPGLLVAVTVNRDGGLDPDDLLKRKNGSEAVIRGDMGVERIRGSSSLVPTTVWTLGRGSVIRPLLIYSRNMRSTEVSSSLLLRARQGGFLMF